MFKLALHWQILIAVLVGAATGLGINAQMGERTSDTTLPDGRVLHVQDSRDRTVVRLSDQTGHTLEEWIVDPSGQTEGALVSLEEWKKKAPKTFDLFHKHGRSVARQLGDAGNLVGGLFLRLLRMVSIPLIIASLLAGVLSLADAARLGKMFLWTGTYYAVTSLLAVVTGLSLTNLIQPGLGSGAPSSGPSERVEGNLGSVLYAQLESLIPVNPIAAAASNEFLSVIAFTLAFGVCTLLVGSRHADRIRELADSVFEVLMTMTKAIIRLAPVGVLGLMLYVTATQGLAVFQALGWYVLTVALGLIIHSVITLPLFVYFLGGRNPLTFARAMSPALLTAFSSASSNATLPVTMTCVEERAGISNRVSSFVLPLGATVNMDGTALFEAAAVLFIAQFELGYSLPLTDQLIIVLTALLASVGAAGIPHAGLVMMVIILQAVGLPADRVGLILAVDRILDMARTAVNVWSDACGCTVLDRYEKLTEPQPAAAPASVQSKV